MTYEEMHNRYHNDPLFCKLVDAMVHAMGELEFSPGELRMAAVFAEIRFQERRMCSPYLVMQDMIKPIAPLDAGGGKVKNV